SFSKLLAHLSVRKDKDEDKDKKKNESEKSKQTETERTKDKITKSNQFKEKLKLCLKDVRKEEALWKITGVEMWGQLFAHESSFIEKYDLEAYLKESMPPFHNHVPKFVKDETTP
ncbi:hypothetical protein RFI_39086, partial [Reticulomyxa filosa]